MMIYSRRNNDNSTSDRYDTNHSGAKNIKDNNNITNMITLMAITITKMIMKMISTILMLI